MRTDYRTFVAALLAVWVLASAADAADIRPTIGSRVRVKALALGPGWHEGMFNRTRTEPACSIVVFFKPRPSRTDALEASSTIYVRDVTALEVYTGGAAAVSGLGGRRSRDISTSLAAGYPGSPAQGERSLWRGDAKVTVTRVGSKYWLIFAEVAN